MEERRIACVQNVMKKTADTHRSVLPIVQKCLDGVISAAESINPREVLKSYFYSDLMLKFHTCFYLTLLQNNLQ